MPFVPADTQCSNISSPIGKAPSYTLTSLLTLLVCSLQAITRPRWRRRSRWPGDPAALVAGTRSPVRSPDLPAAFREEECTFRPFALPAITDYPIINHYSRKFPISHPHTVTAPKWGLRWVEPPGRRAGKAAGDLASDPARLPRGSRQFQRQFMLVSGRSLPQLKLFGMI